MSRVTMAARHSGTRKRRRLRRWVEGGTKGLGMLVGACARSERPIRLSRRPATALPIHHRVGLSTWADTGSTSTS